MSPLMARFGLSVLLVAAVAPLGCKRQQVAPNDFGRAWQSMTLRERELFVSGYLDGRSSSQLELCNRMDQEVESIKFRPEIGQVDKPCKPLQSAYSHIEVGRSLEGYTRAYVSVIDEFYKHSECRVVPYTTLLDHLNDQEYKSGEELYKAVRAGKVSMGFFSGFVGMENCYGVDVRNK